MRVLLLADRVYRSALGPHEARQELARGSGVQFDERVVLAFLRALDRMESDAPRRPGPEASR